MIVFSLTRSLVVSRLLFSYSFVGAWFVVSLFGSFVCSLTRSLVLTVVCSLSFLLLVGSCLVHSFVLSPVCSFSRSYVRCLFSYSLVRAWFIRLFSHPFARSHGRTFVVPYLARSFVLGSFTAFILWFVCLFVCLFDRLFSHPFARSYGRAFVVSSLTRSFGLSASFHYLVRSFDRLFSHPFARSYGRALVVYSFVRPFVLGLFSHSLVRLFVSFFLFFICLFV